MKKVLFLSVAFIATFVGSLSLKSYANDNVPAPAAEIKYCAWNADYTKCELKTNGTACYLVDERCNLLDSLPID